MTNFANGYFRRKESESKPESNPEIDVQAEKQQKIERFVGSTGMPRWLAKIAFRDQIQLIRETEEKDLKYI